LGRLQRGRRTRREQGGGTFKKTKSGGLCLVVGENRGTEKKDFS